MVGDVSTRKRFQFIVESIRLAAPNDWKEARILDLGCGKGELELFFGPLGFRAVTGVEMNPESIAEAVDRFRSLGYRFEPISAEEFLENDCSGDWDFVICTEFLEHLADPEEMVTKIASRLKAGGNLIVTIPNGYGPWEIYHRLSQKKCYQNLAAQPPGAFHVQRFTWKEFVNSLERQGFHLIRCAKSDFLSAVYPFNIPAYRSVYLLERVDCWIADWVPRGLASGWYFSFRKEPVARTTVKVDPLGGACGNDAESRHRLQSNASCAVNP